MNPPPPRWAADALGVQPDAGPEAAVAAFLSTVAADGFLPPERAVAAVAVLADKPLPVTADAADETAALIRPEVDAFAAAFWTLPPDDRMARWADLDGRCDDPPSAAFLAHLKPALRLAARPQPDGAAQELADLLRELFVLRDRPRAARRAEWLAGSGLARNWKPVAEALVRDDPVVAALDPVVVRRLARPAAGTDRPATKSERKRTAEKIVAKRRQTVQHEPEREGAAWGGGLWPVFLALFILSALVRGIGSLSRNDTSPPRYYAPPVVAPQKFQFDPPPPANAGRRKAEADVDELREILKGSGATRNGGRSSGKTEDELNEIMKQIEKLNKANGRKTP